jgi:phage-related protein
MKRITAAFYRTPSGNQPVKDWLAGLSKEDRKIVGEALATVEFGWPVGMPACRPVKGSPLWEVRPTIKKGRVEARVIFGIVSDKMLLLHGFEKDPKRQGKDIDVAKERWRDHQRRAE